MSVCNGDEFYCSLSDNQKKKIEERILVLVESNGQVVLGESEIHKMRCDIAKKMYQVLKG